MSMCCCCGAVTLWVITYHLMYIHCTLTQKSITISIKSQESGVRSQRTHIALGTVALSTLQTPDSTHLIHARAPYCMAMLTQYSRMRNV